MLWSHFQKALFSVCVGASGWLNWPGCSCWGWRWFWLEQTLDCFRSLVAWAELQPLWMRTDAISITKQWEARLKHVHSWVNQFTQWKGRAWHHHNWTECKFRPVEINKLKTKENIMQVVLCFIKPLDFKKDIF